LVLQRNPTTFSTTHQVTPHTSIQPWVVSVHHDNNHEPIQLFDEIVSTRQPWQFVTPSYYLSKINAPTPNTTFVGFQNQPPITNINLVPTNLKTE
jgi:hypothetical protein